LLGNVVRKHAPAERNGELVDDQVESRGDNAAPKRTRRRILPTAEKGRGRNIKMPDGLYDDLCLYALKKKVPCVVGGKPNKRSMTISEAVCLAVQRLLREDGAPKTEPNPAGE
jgi:hypothetical protein